MAIAFAIAQGVIKDEFYAGRAQNQVPDRERKIRQELKESPGDGERPVKGKRGPHRHDDPDRRPRWAVARQRLCAPALLGPTAELAARARNITNDAESLVVIAQPEIGSPEQAAIRAGRVAPWTAAESHSAAGPQRRCGDSSLPSWRLRCYQLQNFSSACHDT